MHQSIFNHKLFEIFFDKALIALLILLAGMQINQSLERYKLIEAQRISNATSFVSACNEIWSKVYEYEATVNKEISLVANPIYMHLSAIKNANREDPEITELKIQQEKLLKETLKLINDKKFILGDNFAMHFATYIGLIKAKSEAQKSSGKGHQLDEDSRGVIHSYDKLMASMRFTSNAALEDYLQRLPR